MKEISKLLNYRESIRVVDATLRDGGLVNDFYFEDDFVKKLYNTNIEAGVDYMELGYRASKKVFDESKFGKWKFCSDDHIREIVGENNTDLKLAIMADIGRHDKDDFDQRVNSPVDLVRVAAYIHQMPEAIDMIEDAAKKGYETSCNIMAISIRLSDEEKALADSYARMHNVSLGEAFKKALFEKIEEEYDISVAEDAYSEYIKEGKISRPIEELWEELDL